MDMYAQYSTSGAGRLLASNVKDFNGLGHLQQVDVLLELLAFSDNYYYYY